MEKLNLLSCPEITRAEGGRSWPAQRGESRGSARWQNCRYRPVVLATAAIYLVAAPAFLVMHVTAGMPRWWAIMDTASCLFIEAAILGLSLRSAPKPVATPIC